MTKQTLNHFALAVLGLLLATALPLQAQYTTLYNFTGGSDGGFPYAGLIRNGSTLYGTTTSPATVFQTTTAGVEKVLYTFGTNPNDGSNPVASLVRDSAGNLYGTTEFGGDNSYVTIFEVSKKGAETILDNFFYDAGLAPFYPVSSLVFDGTGNLYGTTQNGGAYYSGTVYEYTTGGSLVVLYSFTEGTDGGEPLAGLVFDSSGNLYGTTLTAGANDYGVVFELSPEPASGCPAGSNTGNGWCETALYSFTGGADGGNSVAPLVLDTTGNLYGTTEFGGIASCVTPGNNSPTPGCGVVFELSPAPASGCAAGTYPGNGWCETPIYTLSGGADGSYPVAGLAIDSAKNLFGTTEYGGGMLQGYNGFGTVFEVSPEPASGCGFGGNVGINWCETPLYAFSGSATGDGAYPLGGIVLDTKDNLYGTTSAGGLEASPTYGYGTVFTVSAPATAAVIMGSSQNPATVGQSVTFTATITSKFSIPNGETITFSAGANQTGTGYITNGVATWTTSFSKAKTYTVKGTYAGDAFHKAAHGTVKEVVDAD